MTVHYYHKPSVIYKQLLKATKPFWWLLALGILATMIGSAVDSSLAWSVKPLINQGFINRNQTFIRWLPLLVIGIFLIRGMALFASNYCITRVGRNLVMGYRQKMFDHLLRLPARYYDQTTSSQLLSTMIYNVEQLAEATTRALLIVIRSTFMVVGLIIVMFTIHWQLTLLFVAASPCIMLVIHITSRRLRKLNHKVQNTMGEVSDAAYQSIQGFREIRIYGGDEQEQQRFYKATHQSRQRELKVVITNSLGGALVQMITALPIAGVLYLSTLPSFGMTAGSFGAMVAAMLGLARPLKRLTRVNSKIQKGVAGAQSIYRLLEEPQEVDQGTRSLKRAQGAIEFRQVSFSYPNREHHVLHHINLKVEPGEMLAVVGRSGSGKSTIVQLLPRFYDPTAGQILLDGIDIKTYRLRDLRDQFALVSQEVVLFNDTIANNIAYGAQKAVTREAIERAAELACVYDFVNELPQGLDTTIGENGVSLSGGQRQRIAIARAFLKDAPIVLFDEATSALDMRVERGIQQSLQKLAKDRTTIVVAHRLSTIEHADQIVVLSEGRIVESGSHRSLIAQKGEYSALYVGSSDMAAMPQ